MNQKKIYCLIVDDEPPALRVLEKHVASVPSLELVASCNNAVDALAVLQQHKVDLVFLDIQMPFILGTDFVRTLTNPPKIVFTTAFRKYAVEGFDLDAVDFLLKPVSFERFLKAVNKVLKSNLTVAGDVTSLASPPKEPADEVIYLRADRKNIRVDFADILFVEGMKDYVKVVTKEKSIVANYSISYIEQSLPRNLFIRIHRSFIVSIKNIDFYTPELVQVAKHELPISRSYRHEVEKMLKQE